MSDKENINEEEVLEEEDVEVEKEEVDEVNEEVEDLKNQLLRLQADFTNYKRRNEQERTGLVSLGVETIVTDILPIVDNFDRAMEVKEIADEGFYEGIAMIKSQLTDVLKKHGVEEIKALGEEFDPNYHYAVQMQDAEEGKEANKIVMVMQKGYMLKEKVIRPSMVIVSK